MQTTQLENIRAQPSPLNNGLTLNTAIGPRLENCPIDDSKRNKGNPIIATIIK